MNGTSNTNASTLDDLERFAKNHKGWLFRGHRCPEWKLETSLERASRRCGQDEAEYEKAVWGEFRRHAHSYLQRVPADSDTFEWLALMQHYGAPTRLLDFTYSFWIALFFAFEEANEDCAVVALNPSSLAKNHPGVDCNKILREDAFHPQLKTHKLKGKLAGSWACSAGDDLRFVFQFVKYEGQDAILREGIGTHEGVY